MSKTIKYIGAKTKLLPYIKSSIENIIIKDTRLSNLRRNEIRVFDGFSGSTRVTQMLGEMGFSVYTNDISEYSRVFSTSFLLSEKSDEYYKSLINHLNSLKGFEGWFTEYYGANEDDLRSGLKRPFQKKNTMKLDAIREEIDKMDLIDYPDKCVLLTSLINALDKVDNTLGHFSSYLKGFCDRSYKDLHLEIPYRLYNVNEEYVQNKHKIFKDDIKHIVSTETDIAYFDPPYGSNNDKMPSSRVRYSSYYHLWNTIVLNDYPKVFGKNNRREDSRDNQETSYSAYEDYRKDKLSGVFKAQEEIKGLLTKTNSKYVIFSYNNNGRVSISDLIDIIDETFSIQSVQEFNHMKNVMGEMKWTNDWKRENEKENKELLIVGKKR